MICGEALKETLTEIRENLRKGVYPNESAVSQGIVLRMLQALSWPVFDMRSVIPEYSVESGRVDYALCPSQGRPLVFVEVKRVGNTESGDKQLFQYAFHHGVPLLVLTDGQDWHFYLPAGEGDYGDRKYYLLDILERDLDECVYRLERYLAYDNVRCGKALESATSDYKDVAKKNAIKEWLPKAWNRLLVDKPQELLDMLVAKAANLSGFEPTLDDAAKFLDSVTHSSVDNTPPKLGQVTLSQVAGKAPAPSAPQQGHGTGFEFYGQWHGAKNCVNIAHEVLMLLAKKYPGFLERFAARRHGRSRQLVARDRRDLYANKDQIFCDEHSRSLMDGFWMGTNYSRDNFDQLLRMACEVAGTRYSVDLKIQWP